MNRYRVTFDPCIMNDGVSPFICNEVGTFEEAERQLNAIASYTLHLHEFGAMTDSSNFGFIEFFEAGRWHQHDWDN